MKKILTSILVVVTMFMFAIFAVGCESTTKTADESSAIVSLSDTSFYLKYFDGNDVYEKSHEIKKSDSHIDMWEVTYLNRHEPVVLPGTETIDLYIEELGENGEISVGSYETSIVSKISKEVRDVNGVNWEETTNGNYILYKHYMHKALVHYTNSGTTVYPCDVKAYDVVDCKQNKVLLEGWHKLWVYDLNTKSANLISEKVLDFKTSKETLTFCDDNHIEWKCNWTKNAKIQKTGRKEVISYIWENNTEPKVYSDYNKLFAKMQQTVKSDSNFEDEWGKEFEKTFPVYHLLESSLFSGSEFVDFSTNIHFPKPYEQKEGFYLDYKGAADYYDSVFYATWLVDNPKNKLYLYRYGKELIQYKLPKGNWRLLDCDGRSERDLNSIKVLLLNLSNRSMYVVQNGKVKKIQRGLQDIEVIKGEVFWLDAKGYAYQLDWPKGSKSVLLEKNVVGLDCCGGILDIIVSKNDPRATQDQSDKGYFIENIYGR